MEKIDRRRHYILILDTETANTLTTDNGGLDMSCVLFYDCGWAVVDTKGNIYETASYVNKDIFVDRRDLMQSAYYKDKLPQYSKDIHNGTRVMATTYEIRKAMLETIAKYGIKEVAAFNARFDDNALKVTQRYCTSSKWRFWFPFDSVEIWDIMKMAQDVICAMPTYQRFCETNGYTTKTGKPRKTAEILYRFISNDNSFVESHTGLEDVLIEAAIMRYCYRQKKAMRKRLYEEVREFPANTPFQIELLASLRKEPMIRRG